ncbi:MAG: thiamine pyrophosphate-binding protein [Granulosicoccus sp.]|nr:thiamine pyrophosphate-binding protein [Granulosicoccus sp.]
MRTGGQLVVDSLEAQQCSQVFCVPGESYLAVLDALHDSGINTTVCRQEGGAAMMAEAWGKLTGLPGICLVTRGPGATNAAAGVHVAAQDSTPMILFVGQIDSRCRHREAFQEVDYRLMFGDMAKWVAEIDSAARVPEMISRAWHTATAGRPGPVVLVLPEDTLEDTAVVPVLKPVEPVETVASEASVHQLKMLLETAQKPMIIAGGSRWSEAAVSQLGDFAQRFDIPVACSFRRQMLFDNEHPCYAGDVGLGINPDLKDRLESADVLLMIGGRLSEISSQNYTLLNIPDPVQKLIHVHPGAEELGKVYQPHLAIHSSPVAFCAALSSLQPGSPVNWQGASAEAHTSYQRWTELGRAHPDALMMKSVMQCLREQLPADSIMTNGAGNYATWVHRFWKFRNYGSQVAPTSGSMGYGLPAAVAAKLHAPDKTVVAFAGDGCFQMTGQEFGTAVQSGAAIVVLVLDNGMYGTIRMHQEKHFPGRISATTLQNPDFAMLARAYGVYAETVNQPEEFASAFDTALKQTVDSGKPALLHVMLDPAIITPTMSLND